VNPEAPTIIRIERHGIRHRRQRGRLEDSADGTARAAERQAMKLSAYGRTPPAPANFLPLSIPRKFRKLDPMTDDRGVRDAIE